MRPFVDTNVLVYAHDTDEPEKRRVALALLADIGPQMVLSAQVLAEFYVTLTRKLQPPLDEHTAAEQVAALRVATTVVTDADLVSEAVHLSQTHQLSLWDAMIVRAAVRGGCDVLFSEDLQHGQVLDGVTIRDPFQEGADTAG